jgi:hypothetical protein
MMVLRGAQPLTVCPSDENGRSIDNLSRRLKSSEVELVSEVAYITYRA